MISDQPAKNGSSPTEPQDVITDDPKYIPINNSLILLKCLPKIIIFTKLIAIHSRNSLKLFIEIGLHGWQNISRKYQALPITIILR